MHDQQETVIGSRSGAESKQSKRDRDRERVYRLSKSILSNTASPLRKASMDGNLCNYVQSKCISAGQVAENHLQSETVAADQVHLVAALPVTCGASPVMASQQAPTLDASVGMR